MYNKTKKLTTLAVLVAMHVILSRFLSYSVWNMKIGLDFLPVAVGAMLYGVTGGAVVGAVGDFIGAILLFQSAVMTAVTVPLLMLLPRLLRGQRGEGR